MSHSIKLFSVYGVCLNDLQDEVIANLLDETKEDIENFGVLEFSDRFDKLTEKLPNIRGNTGIFLQVEDECYFGYGSSESAYGENVVYCHDKDYDTEIDLRAQVQMLFNDPKLPVLLYYGITNC